MARYIASNEIPAGCKGHAFVGWDTLNGPAEEATEAKHLGLRMPQAFKVEFEKLGPGETLKVHSGRTLFREF